MGVETIFAIGVPSANFFWGLNRAWLRGVVGHA